MFRTGEEPSSAEQRRLARRVPLQVPVFCRLVDSAAPGFWAEAHDISLRGIGLRPPHPLFRPARIRLSLRLPGGERRLQVTATLVNLRRDADGVLAGFTFVDLSRESTVELCRFLFDR